MGTKANIKSKPQIFELNKIENPLFSRAKVFVMYHGKNPNGTIISKDAVERNIHTIKNIPIVGEFSREVENFKGHGGALELDEYGDIEFIHTTSPLGVIPESANVYWEIVKDSKDIEREYLVVDGAYIWNRYEKEVSALKKDNYGQSMEIEIMDGEWVDNENAYDIKEFAFSAFCILGIDRDGAGRVEPAFSDAKIITYNNKDFGDELNEMLKEFKFSLGQEEKGVNGLNLEKLLEKYSLTVEDLQAKGINIENFESESDLEEKIKEVFEKEDEEDKVDVPDEQITEVTMGDGQIEDDKDVEDMAENKVVKDVSGGDTEGAVDGGGADTADAVDTVATDANTEVTENTTTDDGDGTQVTDANTTGSVDYGLEIQKLEEELEEAKSTIDSLQEQVKEYAKKEHEGKANSLINKFMKNFGLEDEDVQVLNIHEMSIDSLEAKLYEIVGRKASESKKEEVTNKFSIETSENTDDVPYAGLFEKIK